MSSAAQHMQGETILGNDTARALLWSLLAGLATTLGGLLAVIRRPEAGLLAFLLGTAIGVMATLSVLELFIENAVHHGAIPVALCAAAGGATYVLLEPLLPHYHPDGGSSDRVQAPVGGGAAATEGGTELKALSGAAASTTDALPTPQHTRVTRRTEAAAAAAAAAASKQAGQVGEETPEAAARRHNLLRLGFLMAVTMTLHNLPEGFAVAFASMTEFGPVMALAVAVHNVPEGLIVSAPIYAATGSRRSALLAALASGLSEPLGAALALALFKPFLTPLRLQLMLAYVGGIMTAVCYLELLPEGRKCGKDGHLARGTLVGGVLMAATLLYV